jgi:nitrogenase iron protein
MVGTDMIQIAVYGKGGIGKSTLSAQISAALALRGKRVLQIGCDPKHDSTRLLLGGAVQQTVLDYIRVTNPLDYDIEAVLFHGFGGVGCVEAGGPAPGVGCAGRGIISTFEFLDRFAVKEQYDVLLYDVLGDVVCGGFAVPIRREYADAIFLVTSGEYMSLYAANNILRGVLGYDEAERRVAGIFYNKRGLDGEDERFVRFSEAVRLPVFAEIPRSPAFAVAEKAGQTLLESGIDPDLSAVFDSVAERIIQGMPLYAAQPLSDDELERRVFAQEKSAEISAVVALDAAGGKDIMNEKSGSVAVAGTSCGKGKKPERDLEGSESNAEERPAFEPEGEERPASESEERSASEPAQALPRQYLSKNIIHSEPLHGCAFSGAVSVALQIQDAVVLAHAPKSCAFLSFQTLSSAGRRGLFERGALLPVSLSPNLECTDMQETDMVFGGMDALSEKLARIKAKKPSAVVIVSSCPAGIIGDSVDRFMSAPDADIPVVVLKADGNMTGDYLQGMIMSYTRLATALIRKDVPKVPRRVNLVFEKIIPKNLDTNFRVIKNLLTRMNIDIGCRFLCETDLNALSEFCSAELNLLASKDYTGRLLEDFFKDTYGARFLEEPFPIGFDETVNWLNSVGGFFRSEAAVAEIIEENRAAYEERIRRVRPALEGKRLLILTYNHNLDWILRAALGAGVEVTKIGVFNFSQDAGFVSNLDVALNVEEAYDKENRQRDIDRYRPDIVLSNYDFSFERRGCISDVIPMCPDVGFFTGVEMAERWAKMIHQDFTGDWRQDERLYQQHYA